MKEEVGIVIKTYTGSTCWAKGWLVTLGSYSSSMLSLCLLVKQVLLQNYEVVHKLDAQVWLCLDIVLDVDDAVDLYVDGEAVACELRWYFLVNFDEHVMRAPDNTLLRLLLTDAVCQPQLVQGDLRYKVVNCAAVDFLCLRSDIRPQLFWVCHLRVSKVHYLVD